MNGFSFVANSANDQTPERTLSVLTYELGRVVELEVKTQIYGPQGYLGSHWLEHADLISMARMYAEQKGWDFDELMKFGEERYLERMDDIRKHGKTT